EPEWRSECGTHLEGVVESIEGGALISINLNVTRGTGARGPAIVTRLSREWLTFDGSDLPRPQQTVRVTDTGFVEDTLTPAVFRADRITTAVWTLPTSAP